MGRGKKEREKGDKSGDSRVTIEEGEKMRNGGRGRVTPWLNR
jgi:hypothetical protein